MYWTAPEYALYQGDLLTVPYVQITPDPQVISETEVAQKGDLCPICTTGTLLKPRREKRYATFSVRTKKNDPALQQMQFPVVASLRPVVGLTLSQSCDIDRASHIRFAVVQPLSEFTERMKERIRNGEVLNYFHLEATAEMPEAAANLDMQFSLAAKILGKQETFEGQPILVPYVDVVGGRIASLGEGALKALYERNLRRDTRSKDLTFDFGVADGTLEVNERRRAAFPQHKSQVVWPRPSWLMPQSLQLPLEVKV